MMLMNLDSAQHDEEGTILADILTQIGASTTGCTLPTSLSSADGVVTTAWTRQKDDILKYIRISDRYLALASILLKSRAFYHARGRETTTSKERRPPCIVDLPRTIHNKPFIPSGLVPTPENEENLYPMSISHQFPFAGMLILDTRAKDVQKVTSLLAGLDIVVFDEINPKLYESVQDFIDVFHGSFTAAELSAMNDEFRCPDDASQLRELYLRWAIKEAYTKALGVGMGTNFASFETVLDSLDSGTSLWSWISSSKNDMLLITMGSVDQLSSTPNDEMQNRQQREKWRYFFQPLYDGPVGAERRDSQKMRGCACACIGPFDSGIESYEGIDIDIDWTDIKKLMSWHGEL